MLKGVVNAVAHEICVLGDILTHFVGKFLSLAAKVCRSYVLFRGDSSFLRLVRE